MPEFALLVVTKLETKFAERLLDAMSPMLVRPEAELMATPQNELVAETAQALREAFTKFVADVIALLTKPDDREREQ